MGDRVWDPPSVPAAASRLPVIRASACRRCPSSLGALAVPAPLLDADLTPLDANPKPRTGGGGSSGGSSELGGTDGETDGSEARTQASIGDECNHILTVLKVKLLPGY